MCFIGNTGGVTGNDSKFKAMATTSLESRNISLPSSGLVENSHTSNQMSLVRCVKIHNDVVTVAN